MTEAGAFDWVDGTFIARRLRYEPTFAGGSVIVSFPKVSMAIAATV
jgi:hypothetical protein